MSAHLPALVVALTVLLLTWCTWLVGRARGRYGIKAPATSGHEAFERVFRMQMNTVESTVAFLPCLWLATQYGPAWLAGILGLVWLAGRTWYTLAYCRAAPSRGPGFIIAATAAGLLLAQGLWGLLRVLLLA